MKLYEALTEEWLVLHNDQKALSDESYVISSATALKKSCR